MADSIWNDPGLEPKRAYRWLLRFGTASDAVPEYICKKVDKPSFSISEQEHVFLNHKFWYPGRVEWNEVKVTIVDPLAFDAANRLQQIIAERKAAANKEKVTEDASTPQEDRTRGEARREAKEDRKEDRKEKVEQKRNYRLEKINAVKEKIYAVASKRKWLFFIIVGAIVAYLVIFKGGFGGGDILTKIKGFFG